MWNERYRQAAFVYGQEPNRYLEDQLGKLTPGKILFPAEGEGRNAVFAAKRGWVVSAFDISAEGQKKARQLALQNQVTINYEVGELSQLGYEEEEFDAVALIYAHFPAAVKSSMHQTLNRFLRRGGTVILEAFSKNHLSYQEKNVNVGGPNDVSVLFSTNEIRADFPHYDVLELQETSILLSEGQYHQGEGSVIRFVGRKQ